MNQSGRETSPRRQKFAIPSTALAGSSRGAASEFVRAIGRVYQRKHRAPSKCLSTRRQSREVSDWYLPAEPLFSLLDSSQSNPSPRKKRKTTARVRASS